MRISTERKLFVSLPVVLVLAICVGCGGSDLDLTPVSGVVTLDGDPVEGAMVTFEPEEGGRPSMAETDASGKFSLKTLEPGDGALVGPNKVAVMKTTSSNPGGAEDEESDGGYDGTEEITHHLPIKYASTRTSELVIEVTKGMDSVELKLDSQ